MKILAFGISMFATGSIGYAILCAAAICCKYSNGTLHYLNSWKLFDVTHIASAFLTIGIIGFAVSLADILASVVGCYLKKKRGS